MLTEGLARKLEAIVATSPYRQRTSTDQAAWPSLLRRLVSHTGLSRSAVQRAILNPKPGRSQSIGSVSAALQAEQITWAEAQALYRDRRAELSGHPSGAAQQRKFETMSAGSKLARGEPISRRERRLLEHARSLGFDEASRTPIGRTGDGSLPTLRAWVATWAESKKENASEADTPEALAPIESLPCKGTTPVHSTEDDPTRHYESLRAHLEPLGAIALASQGKKPSWAVEPTEGEARDRLGEGCDARQRADGKWCAWRAYEPGHEGGFALLGHDLVCIDIDEKNGKSGMADLGRLSEEIGGPPASLITKSPNGFHCYFRLSPDVGASITNGKLGGFDSLDVRTCGGFLAEFGAGRSIHADSKIAALPAAWVAKLPRRAAVPGAKQSGGCVEAVWRDPKAVEKFSELCERHAPAAQGRGGHGTIFKLAMQARDFGLPPGESEPIAWARYNPRCNPPWRPDERRDFAHQFEGAWEKEGALSGAPGQAALDGRAWVDLAISARPAAAWGPENEATEAWLAERLAREHGHHLRCVAGRWFAWDGKRWAAGAGLAVAFGAVKQTAREVRVLAAGLADDAARNRLTGCANKALTARGIRDVLTIAEHLEPFRAGATDFDSDPWLLNVENGTIDLRTQTLLPHSPSRMCSQLATVSYEPDAEAPTFDAFLTRILPSEDLKRHVLKVIGYTLTGVTTEHAWFYCMGTGRNGKNTLLELLAAMLGDYARTIDAAAVTMRPDGNEGADVKTALADLEGLRLAFLDELEPSAKWSSKRLKQITGSGTLTARRMRQDGHTFPNTAKLWIATNADLEVRDHSEGFWTKLHKLDFRVRIPDAEIDRELPAKLRAELPGVLNIALAGLRAYQENGLGPPAVVSAAVASYQENEDTLMQWARERVEYAPEGFTPTADLEIAYQAWCTSQGDRPVPSRAFQKGVGAKLAVHLGVADDALKTERSKRKGYRVIVGPLP